MTVVPAALTLVLGGVFLGRASMAVYETATWFSSILPVSHIIGNSTYVDVVFLPYYLFMHFWLGVSQSLWWMRLPSLLAGAATVEALVLLARRWLPLGWSVLAGFLLALNPLFAAWTIQARPYTAAALFAVLSTTALVNAIQHGGMRRWTLYGLASLCMLLLHLLAVFVLVAQLAGVAIARRRSALVGMVATIGCVAIAVSPLAVKAAGEAKQISWIPPTTLGTFNEVLADVSGGHIAYEIALVICGLIVIASLAVTPTGSDRTLGFALCLAWGAVPALLLVLVSLLHPLYVSRYAVVCLPGVALTEALAGWRVWTILAVKRSPRYTSGSASQAPTGAGYVHRRHRQRWAFVAAAITCGAACLAGLGLLAHTSSDLQRRYYSDDYRSAAAALSKDLSERPAPVAIIPNTQGIGFSYYVTLPRLAHALAGPVLQAFNMRVLHWPGAFAPGLRPAAWLRYSSVVEWPIGTDPDPPAAQCAAGWAIGGGSAVPSKPFIIDGSSCRVYQVRHYGAAWVASLTG
ncbi:MAG: glycosyltransferase family 39 protein [Actinobacteria bacterium]|nr:glycosyltransferase family 39 protein [Actinomycetota bacterium]